MSKRSGFSLLEVAIVLIIIALIIAGLIVGRSLIRSAEIRSAVNESEQYTNAINTFRDKYLALPGDFSDAIDLWGAAHVVPATCKTTSSLGSTATCDGDGDGRISIQSDSTTFYEEFRAWQHLTNANLIEATVSGIAQGANRGRVVGTSIPRSQLSGAGWGLTSVTIAEIAAAAVTDIVYVTGDIAPNHVLWLGGNSIDSTNDQTPRLTVEEAVDIDTKTDDGLANTGKIVAQDNPSAPDCMDVSNEYDTAETTQVCTLVFKTGF